MNITQFKDTVNRQGLAKTSNWILRVYPPSGLSSTNSALSNFLSTGGNKIDINLPGLDLLDQGVEILNDLNVNVGGGVQINSNLNIPTLGYTLSNMGDTLTSLNLFAVSCTIPSRDLSNVDWTEYGEIRKLGVKHVHSDFSTRYYCSEDLRERLFFEQWQDLIFNPQSKKHSYYKDYIATVEVVKYNSSWTEQTAIYKFNECYPTNVGAMELTHESGLLELDITWKYRNYERIL